MSVAKRIADVVMYWPPTTWACSYGPGDGLRPNSDTAGLMTVKRHKQYISLIFSDRNQLFNTTIQVADNNMLNHVERVLLAAKGKTIAEIGMLPVDC